MVFICLEADSVFEACCIHRRSLKEQFNTQFYALKKKTQEKKSNTVDICLVALLLSYILFLLVIPINNKLENNFYLNFFNSFSIYHSQHLLSTNLSIQALC